MFFTIRNVPIQDNIYTNGGKIEKVDNFTFLGELIDAKFGMIIYNSLKRKFLRDLALCIKQKGF